MMRDLKELYEEWNAYEGDRTNLYSPLVKAVREADLPRLARLLEKENPSLEDEAITPSRYALRPIHFAADICDDATSAAALTMLLRAGADRNAKTRIIRNWTNPLDNLTPLYMAVVLGQHAAALALLGWSADPNIACRGWIPLHLAAQMNDALMAHVLAEKEADVDARAANDGVMTPLHLAASVGAEKACKALWCAGANLVALDGKGRTPMGVARENGYEDTAKLMLWFGAKDEARAIGEAILPGAPVEDGGWKGAL